VAQGGGDRRTIVVVAADHGEAFGDHGTITHGKSLYEEQTHVPLVVAIPGGQPRTAAGPVGLVDLAPTLLDLVGVDTPPGMSGISLAAVIRDGAPVPDHPVLSELVRDARVPRDLLALHTPGWKLIRDLEVDTVELYDLAADPGELEDRSDEPLAAELRERLDRLADTELSPLQSPQAPR
jgi:arylsulfatase A-like enzyme